MFNTAAGSGVPVPGAVTWSDDNTAMTFTPNELLERDSTYAVNITQGAQALNGAPMALEQEFLYYTYGKFAPGGSDPTEGGAKSETGSVRVYFTSPPKYVDNLEDYI